MKNEILIGLEIHGYIDTEKKLFCNCKNFHDMKQVNPNMNICPICTGQPGAKPMLPNESAINKIIEIALMLNCKISNRLIFQRKHYDWPDMPYGYQKTISGAYSKFVGFNGKFLGIRIREIHLEEDPAAWNPDTGAIDYNRAGAPLVEIVTEPDFHSSEEVEEWLRKLILTLSYIKALNKDAGIKSDVNVNIRGVSKRVEIKNVNSISEIVNSIKFEVDRHKKEKPQTQETRKWDADKKITKLMRSKENQADYKFIPDPDLPVVKIKYEKIKKIKNHLPESPMKKLEKLVKKYGIDKKNAEILTKNLEVVELFEKVAEKTNPSFVLPWITIEWIGVLNYNKISMEKLDINPNHFIELMELIQKNKITPLKAKEILRKFIPKSFSPNKEKIEIFSEEKLKKIIRKILEKNKKVVDDYKSGNINSINFLIGQVMKETNKQADYKIVKEILKNELDK